MNAEKLVRSCLYNWLGYGNPDAETWFVGSEEGGAEIQKKGSSYTEAELRRNLRTRSEFGKVEDFHRIWKTVYGYGDSFADLVRNRNNVWRHIAAFQLYKEGKISTSTPSNIVAEKVTAYLLKDFGSRKDRLFFCEFLPLPRTGWADFPDMYQEVWASPDHYADEVAPKRLYLIRQALLQSKKVKLVVSFGLKFTVAFLKQYPVNRQGENGFPTTLLKQWAPRHNEKYALLSVNLENGRTIKFLKAPFFRHYLGYGKNGLPYAATL